DLSNISIRPPAGTRGPPTRRPTLVRELVGTPPVRGCAPTKSRGVHEVDGWRRVRGGGAAGVASSGGLAHGVVAGCAGGDSGGGGRQRGPRGWGGGRVGRGGLARGVAGCRGGLPGSGEDDGVRARRRWAARG